MEFVRSFQAVKISAPVRTTLAAALTRPRQLSNYMGKRGSFAIVQGQRRGHATVISAATHFSSTILKLASSTSGQCSPGELYPPKQKSLRSPQSLDSTP